MCHLKQLRYYNRLYRHYKLSYSLCDSPQKVHIDRRTNKHEQTEKINSTSKVVYSKVSVYETSVEVNSCTIAGKLVTLTGSASITTCTAALPGVSRLTSGVRIVKPSLVAFSCIPLNYNQ